MSYFLLSALLFCGGLFMVLTRKNGVVVLMGVELLLNASLLNFVGFGGLDGQMTALFIIVIAAAEVAVALAIILNLYERFGTADLDEANKLGD
jgi:NADH:ubiquinone oxidoreductase subunit K